VSALAVGVKPSQPLALPEWIALLGEQGNWDNGGCAHAALCDGTFVSDGSFALWFPETVDVDCSGFTSKPLPEKADDLFFSPSPIVGGVLAETIHELCQIPELEPCSACRGLVGCRAVCPTCEQETEGLCEECGGRGTWRRWLPPDDRALLQIAGRDYQRKLLCFALAGAVGQIFVELACGGLRFRGRLRSGEPVLSLVMPLVEMERSADTLVPRPLASSLPRSLASSPFTALEP